MESKTTQPKAELTKVQGYRYKVKRNGDII